MFISQCLIRLSVNIISLAVGNLRVRAYVWRDVLRHSSALQRFNKSLLM